MAHVAFLVAALSVTLLFVWRRQLDPLAVAVGSSLVYFAPGILGMMRFGFDSGHGHRWYTEPVEAATYVAMGIVLVALAAGAAVVDRVPQRGAYAASFQSKIPGILLVFVAVATLVSILHTGLYFLCLDKSIVLEKIGPWYSYASISAPFCIATAYALRQRVIVVIGCLFLVADVFVGFRTALAISLLAIMMLSGERLFRGWKAAAAFSLIVLLVGIAFFVTKQLIVPVKYATASYCETRLALDKAAGSTTPSNKVPTEPGMTVTKYLDTMASNYSRYFHPLNFIAESEPFVIQATLNEVIRRNFRTDPGYIGAQLLSGLPLGTSLFGIENASLTTFNSRVQPVLFPDVGFSMANSPWAQAYAGGGLWMVAAFAVGYAAILGGLTLLFHRTEGALKAGVAVIGLWAGFYFHRNDVLIEIIYLKHAVYIFCAALVVAWAASIVGRRAIA